MLETSTILGGLAAATIAAALAAAMPEKVATATQAAQEMVSSAANTTVSIQINVMDDDRLRAFGLLGALLGSLATVALIYPTASREQKDPILLLRKFLASACTSFFSSAWIMEWIGAAKTSDRVLFTYGITALLAWTVLLEALPFAAGFVKRWLSGRTQDPPPSTQ